MAETEQSDVMSLTVTLLSAYFVNNTVPSSELPALVEGTRKALLGGAPAVAPSAEVGAPSPSPEPAGAQAPSPESASRQPAGAGPASAEPPSPEPAPAPAPEFKPAVSVADSLASPDQILSLIDGKPYKALKRHLGAHGLTFEEYKARYDLPSDYPKVAPGYSAARREVAMRMGLGGKRKGALPADAAEPDVVPEEEVAAEAEAVPEGEATADGVATIAGEPAAPEPVAAEPVTAADAAKKPARARRTRTKAGPAEAAPAKSKARTKAAPAKSEGAVETAPAKARKPRAAKAAPKPKKDAVETEPAAE